MKPHKRSRGGRIRRAAKWAGLVVCVLFAVAWLYTLRFNLSVSCMTSPGRLWSLHVESGGLAGYCFHDGSWPKDAGALGWRIDSRRHGPNHAGVEWMPDWFWERPNPSLLRFGVFVPLWMLLLAAAGPTLWLWWRDRRARPGHCAACGYDLAGLAPDAACPECGKAHEVLA